MTEASLDTSASIRPPYNRKNRAIRFAGALIRKTTGVVESWRTDHAAIAEIEQKRREALGMFGRIVEDARQAVDKGNEPFLARSKQKARELGISWPLADYYPDSDTSATLQTIQFLRRHTTGAENVIARLGTPMFGFAYGITDNHEYVCSPEGMPELFLVGTEQDGTSIVVAHRLDDTFVKTHSLQDIKILEIAARDVKVASSNETNLDSSPLYV